MIPVARPQLGDEEIEAVTAVLRSGNLVQGKLVERFEETFANCLCVKHAIAVCNGTAALHAALLAHGIGPGDEVITTPFSFIATANAVLYTGATPVFVDVCPDTLNIDPRLIEVKVTPRTRAIIPVHLYGHPADMAAICDIAARYGLAVIEDAAQAHGASIGDRMVGTFGTACFSFYATKNVMTAEGGMVTTDDDQVADRLRLLRSHGSRERYRHEMLGYNYRMTDIQAAIGLAQIGRLQEVTARRISNAQFLSAHLGELRAVEPRPGCRHVYHQYTIRLPRGRDDAVLFLKEAGVGTAIHYPIPIHKQKLYLDLGYTDSLPVAEQASREVISLPVHPSLTEEDLETVAREVSNLPRRLWQ